MTNRNHIIIPAAFAAGLAAFALMGACLPDPEPTPEPTAGVGQPLGPTYNLGPCQVEDAQNCYWDAATMGNGQGTSFVNLDGKYYYAR